MRRRAALSLLVAACSFDATGQTGAGGGGAGVGSTTGTSGAMTTGEPGTSSGPGVTTGGVGMSGTTGPVDPTTGADTSTGPAVTSVTTTTTTTGDETTTTTSDDTTTAPDPSTTTGTSDATTTTGGDECPGPVVKLLELVADADVVFPMEKEQSQAGEGTIASSPVAALGTVEFTFDVACAGEYAVWARVYDGDPGVHDFGDPDSFHARVDGGSEITWYYGCQTEELNSGWSWQRIREPAGDTCGDAIDWTLALAPGSHEVRLRNRESQTNGGTRAAVARILVTNDLSYTPTNE